MSNAAGGETLGAGANGVESLTPPSAILLTKQAVTPTSPSICIHKRPRFRTIPLVILSTVAELFEARHHTKKMAKSDRTQIIEGHADGLVNDIESERGSAPSRQRQGVLHCRLEGREVDDSSNEIALCDAVLRQFV